MQSDSDNSKAVRRAAAISDHLIFWNTRSNFNRRAAGSSESDISEVTGKMIYPGGCYCAKVRYEISLDNGDKDARTSLCHCGNCKVMMPVGYDVRKADAGWNADMLFQHRNSLEVHLA